jgi:hypothetical protein
MSAESLGFTNQTDGFLTVEQQDADEDEDDLLESEEAVISTKSVSVQSEEEESGEEVPF